MIMNYKSHASAFAGELLAGDQNLLIDTPAVRKLSSVILKNIISLLNESM